MRIPMKNYRLWLFVTFACFLAAGCGGSSSNSNPASGATGGLTLLVGDSPDEEFDEIDLIVENIILIGEDGQRDLKLPAEIKVDLLQLRNLTELLVDTEVPVGDYSKIRLLISGLVLRELDDMGREVRALTPPLPANGKIDLNPQGEFTIRAGQDLIVEIDVDLDRSLKVTSTGSGEYRFRPVVFVDVIEQEDRARLVRLAGTITNYEAGNPQFDLCYGDNEEHCVAVNLSDSALIIDESGTVLEPGALSNDLIVTVFGRFDGEDQFNALVLAFGDESELSRLEGTVAVEPNDQGVFVLNDEGDEIPIALLDRTLLLDDDGMATDAEALIVGAELEAWTIQPPTEDHIALVIQLDDAEDENEMEVEGEFVAYAEGVFNLVTEAQEEICVRVDAETVFMQFVEAADSVESDEFDLAEFEDRLANGDYTDLALEIEAEGPLVEDCYQAETLVIEIED